MSAPEPDFLAEAEDWAVKQAYLDWLLTVAGTRKSLIGYVDWLSMVDTSGPFIDARIAELDAAKEAASE